MKPTPSLIQLHCSTRDALIENFTAFWCMLNVRACLPHGPAALSPARGLNGCITFATILIQMGTWELAIASGGFSGNPHGSARTKWCKRFGYRIAYADAKNPPKLWPRSIILSSWNRNSRQIKTSRGTWYLNLQILQ